MTVGELIKKLSIYNQDLPITVESETTIKDEFWSSITVKEVGVFTGNNKTEVFIIPNYK